MGNERKERERWVENRDILGAGGGEEKNMRSKSLCASRLRADFCKK